MNKHQRKTLQLKVKSKTLLVEKYDKAVAVKQHINQRSIANMMLIHLLSSDVSSLGDYVDSLRDTASA
jgi:hypothetical protein